MVTYLGLLVQLCCVEGGTLQTNITGMCGECLQCLGHTGFAPAHSVCDFPVYTAQASDCSAVELSKAAPGLRALPRYKPFRFRFSGTPQRHRLCWTAFCALPRSEQLRQPCLVSARSQLGGAPDHLPGPSPSVSWVCSEWKSCLRGAMCLLWGADL